MFTKKKKLLCTIAAVGILATGAVGANNASKEDLRELINTEARIASEYTPITYQEYEECLSRAIEISDEFYSAGDEIDEAYADLQTSIEQLQLLPDKRSLQEAYSYSSNIDQAEFIPQSVGALQHALSVALDTLNNPNSTIDDVNHAIRLLNTSEAELISRPDKTKLHTLLETVMEIDEELYLPSSYSAVEAAIKDANTVLSNENALEDDVNSAVSQLNLSVEKLIAKPDKTVFQELLSQAKAFPEEKYTTVSYNALQKVIDSTSKVLNDKEATQEKVDAATALLQTAINELITSTKGVYQIDIWFSRESNDHVGNSWYYEASYNNAEIDGETITVSHGSTISIYCKVVEDDNIPDVGSGYLSLRMEDGAENSLSISVYENRGRYSGNRAVWIVTATATLIERV